MNRCALLAHADPGVTPELAAKINDWQQGLASCAWPILGYDTSDPPMCPTCGALYGEMDHAPEPCATPAADNPASVKRYTIIDANNSYHETNLDERALRFSLRRLGYGFDEAWEIDDIIDKLSEDDPAISIVPSDEFP